MQRYNFFQNYSAIAPTFFNNIKAKAGDFVASPASCAPLVLRRASSESASPLTKGLQTFRGCVQYVTGKDEAKILASDGVLLGSVGNIADSFEYG